MKTFKFCYKNDVGWDQPLNSFRELDSSQTLVILFGDPAFAEKQDILEEVAINFPSSILMGCSSAGEINGQTISEGSLVCAVTKFEKTDLRLICLDIANSAESFQTGKSLALHLYQSDLKGVFILSDGLNVNGSRLIEGINSILSNEVIVTGGLAADGDRFNQTWIIRNGKAESKVISAVGFYGESVKINHGSRGGWDIFGPERRITRSVENELFELDGKPALQLYKEYLGDRASELPASALLFPLALRKNELEEKQVVRTILSINEEKQSMIFAGDLPQNSLVQLMRANFDRLIDGAADAAIMTGQNFDSEENLLTIAISCVGRRLILGERAEEELEAVLEHLPKQTTQIGFYSYGEISPHDNGHCDLHNQTMTLTTIAEY